jgi:uncharacterized protein YndB with AHSA1/START domain
MTIAPIVKSVDVAVPPARAFEIFTRDFGRWWPKGRTPAKSPHVDVVLEPRAQGRWFEVDADGVETHWGRVLAWDPPERLLLAWQLNTQFAYDPDLVTEVELTFAAEGSGTRVTLEHRNLERYGADAERFAGLLGGGWPGFLTGYADFARAHPR